MIALNLVQAISCTTVLAAIILAFHPLRIHGCCSQNLKSLCARQNCVPRFCLWTSSSHTSRHLQQPLSRTEWMFLPFSEVYGRTDDDHSAKLSGRTLSTSIIVSLNLWRFMRGVACCERFARISAVAKNREAIMAGNEETREEAAAMRFILHHSSWFQCFVSVSSFYTLPFVRLHNQSTGITTITPFCIISQFYISVSTPFLLGNYIISVWHE